jgi:glycosyltransferase involved in cell wall biosynthesis
MPWMTIVACLSVTSSLGWLYFYRRVRLGATRMAVFEDLPSPTINDDWPTVSLIIPAMNEASTLPMAIESLLRIDYPKLELVFINDRSTDATGAILASAAARDARVSVVTVTSLPEGWLGKVHAQQRGVEAASGDWLLFTDADVGLAPHALRRAVGHALRHHLDQVVVVGKGKPPSFLLDVVECSLATLIHGVAALSRRRTRTRTVVGSGLFSLVKRSALARSEGLAWCKMDPADDFALSLLLSRSGASAAAFLSRGDVSCVWYPSFSAMVRGFEKNLFPVATGYRRTPALIIATALWLFNVLPFAAPWVLPAWAAATVMGLPLLALLAATRVRAARSGRSFAALLCNPLGQLVLACVLLRAMIVVMHRGGLVWRDTFYPLHTLRAGQRVRRAYSKRTADSTSSAGS